MRQLLRLSLSTLVFGILFFVGVPLTYADANESTADLRYAAVSVSNVGLLENLDNGHLIVVAQVKNLFSENRAYAAAVEFRGVDESNKGEIYTWHNGEEILLNGAEEKNINLLIPKPNFLAGKYRLSLGVTDRKGNVVALSSLKEMEFTSEGRVEFKDCSFAEEHDGTLQGVATLEHPVEISGSCSMRWTGEEDHMIVGLSAQASKGRYGATQLLGVQNEITLSKQAQKVSFIFPGVKEAGMYQLELFPVSMGTMSPLGTMLRKTLMISGVGGVLSGVTRLDPTHALGTNETVPASAFFSLYDAGLYTLTLALRSDGKDCADALRVTVSGDSSYEGEFVTREACSTPQITATLATEEGKVVDEWKSSNDTPAMHKDNQQLKQVKGNKWMLWGGAGLVVVLLGWLFLRRKSTGRRMMMPVLFFFAASMFFGLGANQAHAGSANFIFFYICSGGTGCPAASSVWFNVDTNKDVYTPGETIYVHLYIGGDDGNQGGCPVFRIGINGSVGSDLIPGCYTAQDIRGDLAFDFTLTAPSGVGPFTVTVSPGLSGYVTPSSHNIPLSVSGATPTASLSISPTSGVEGTMINYTLSSTNAGSCEVVQNPGNTVVLSRSANVTNTSVSSATGVGTWTFSTQCWSGSNGSGTASSVDTDTVTISAASGSFTSTPPCTIASGAAGCNTTIGWTSNAPTAVLTNCGGATLATTGSGSQSANNVYVPYNSGCYQLHAGSAGGSLLASTTITSSCTSGTSWDGSTCAASTAVNGTCGPVNGSTFSSWFDLTEADKCSAGTSQYMDTWLSTDSISNFGPAAPYFTAGGPGYYQGIWWKCNGSNGGWNRGCVAFKEPALCGSANGGTYSSPPADTSRMMQVYCQVGSRFNYSQTATLMSWQCLNSGSPAFCSANLSGGSVPVVNIQASVVVADAPHQTWWQKAVAFVTGKDHIAEASGSPASISTSGTAKLTWTSSGGICNVTGPSLVSSTNNGTGNVQGSVLGVGTFTYTIQCSNAFGTATDTAQVIVTSTGGSGGSGSSPSLSLSASPSSITSGGSSTITWATSGAASCWASGGTSGWANTWKTPSGGSMTVSPTSTTTYYMECWDASGGTGNSSGLRSATVTISGGCSAMMGTACTSTPNSCGMQGSGTIQCDGSCNAITPSNTLCAAPTYTVSASSSGTGTATMFPGTVSGIAQGGSVTENFTAGSNTTITAIIVDGVSIGPRASYTFNNIQANHTIVMNYASTGGVPVATLSATPTAIPAGSQTMLSWTASGFGSGCIGSGSGDPLWDTSHTYGGSLVLSPTTTRTYTLVCTDSNGVSTAPVSVTVAVGGGTVPTVDIQASPTTVAAGGSTTLTWTSSNVNLCHIVSFQDPAFAPAPIQMVSSNGSRSVTPPSSPGNYNYIFECFDSTMVAWSDTVTVTVTGPSTVSGITSFTNPCVITGSGQGWCSFTVDWTTNITDPSPNAVFVRINNSTNTVGQTLGFPTSSSSYTWPPSMYPQGPPDTWTVTLTAGAASGGAILDQKTFSVQCPSGMGWAGVTGCQPLPVVNLTINGSTGPLSVSPGTPLNIQWTVIGAGSGCTASGKWSGSKSTSGGTETQSAVIPSGDYILTCSNVAGSVTKQVTVNLACTASTSAWSACGPPCAGGNGTRSRTITTGACIVTNETQSCTTTVCRDLNWKEVGQ